LLDQWDAFLVFAIKQAGGISNDPQLRQGLFNLLLDSRYRLVMALAHPQSAGPDPVRLLFIDDWRQLGDLIRAAARHGALGNRSLEFLSFVSAGDALFAFDQAAPALGISISADDLRRLAHIMAPRTKENPLAFSFNEDPELRKMFNVATPAETLPSPKASPPASLAVTPAPFATPASSPPNPAMSPHAPIPAPVISSTPTPTALNSYNEYGIPGFFAWLIEPKDAYAALGPSENATLQELGNRLSRVVVDNDNALKYRADIDRLLELTTMREIGDKDVDAQYQPLYSQLVKAVAWQESCWRQFVRKRNRVVFLESSTHDVGLMQINKYVWRGFYNIHKLEWDIIYNSDAGAEILARMLSDVMDKPGAMTPGHPEQLARSAYAAYNGGPDAYRRWRGHESAGARLIDRSFWAKYQAVERGEKIDILSCSAQWGKAPGH
ncbi:MAG: transglycosylase SLT domain-containing protein, partial [Candidatus Binataceae bacterium]